MKSPLIHIVIFALVWLMIILSLLAPFLSDSNAAVLFLAFEKLCHQLPGRSLHIHGASFAVCARCFMIYLGLGIGIGIPLFRSIKFNEIFKPSTDAIWITVFLMGMQWMLELLIPGNFWLIPRMITGFLFGSYAGLFLAHAVSNLNTTPTTNFNTKPLAR